jgi:hypothetical protein
MSLTSLGCKESSAVQFSAEPSYIRNLVINSTERSPLAKAAAGLLVAVANTTRGFESFPLRHYLLTLSEVL